MLILNQFLESIRNSLNEESPYAALALALTLPDICSNLEVSNNAQTKEPYCNFFNKYLSSYFNGSGAVFLKAEDLYALRCAFLHSGRGDIETKSVREFINKFTLINFTHRGYAVHNNKIINTAPSGDIVKKLQLDVKILSTQMIEAVAKWQQNNQNYQDDKLMKIQSSGNLIF